MKSTRAHLEDGCSLQLIEKEVRSLPDEVQGLFRLLLGSIRKPYIQCAFQTFVMADFVQTIEKMECQPQLRLPVGIGFPG